MEIVSFNSSNAVMAKQKWTGSGRNLGKAVSDLEHPFFLSLFASSFSVSAQGSDGGD